MSKKTTTRVIVGLCILGSTLIGALIWKGYFSIGTDGVFYALMGESLARGQGLSVYGVPHVVFSPLLPVLIAFFFLISRNLEFAAWLATFVPVLLSIPLVYLIGNKIGGRRIGLLAAATFSLSGDIIWQDATSPEMLAGLFGILAFVFLLNFIQKDENKILWTVLAGMASGLAYLARPEYFFLVFVNAAMLLVLKKSWRAVVIMILLFFCVAAPYLIFLRHNTGTWTITGRTSELSLFTSGQNYETLDNGPGNDTLETNIVRPPMVSDSLLVSFLKNPIPPVKQLLGGLRDSERNFARAFGFLGLFAIAFGIRGLILRRRFALLLLSGSAVSLVALIALGQGGGLNYLQELFFVPIVFAACGFWFFWDEFKIFIAPHWRNPVVSLAIAFFIGFFFFPVIQSFLFLPKDYRPLEMKELGLWMEKNIPDKGEIIVSRKPDISFYAGGRFALVPYVNNLSELVAVMRKSNAKYLVADTRYFSKTRPQLSSLVSSQSTSDFKFLKSSSYRGQTAYLFYLK